MEDIGLAASAGHVQSLARIQQIELMALVSKLRLHRTAEASGICNEGKQVVPRNAETLFIVP